MELDEHDNGERYGEIRGFGAHFAEWMLVVPVPVGEPCHFCGVPIEPWDAGFTVIRVAETVSRVAEHRECLRNAIAPERKNEPEAGS